MDENQENKPQLDPGFVEQLKTICAKEARELREDEIAFLRSRWHYVGKKSRAKFDEVVNGKAKKKEDTSGDKGKAPKEQKDFDFKNKEKKVEDDDDGEDEVTDTDGTQDNPFEKMVE